jgi:hypothetical protein
MKKIFTLTILIVMAFPAIGQWSDDPEENNQIGFESIYDWDSRVLSDGSFIIYYNRPSSIVINQETMFSIKHVLMRYNADGTPAWDEPLVAANTFNLTWVAVNNCLFIDNNDNIFLNVPDCRYDTAASSKMSLSICKINKDGEHLWGDYGVSIDKEEHGFIAQSNSIALEDGSIIVAWSQGDGNDPFKTKIARLSASGQVLWQKDLSPAGNTARLVNGGNNEFIIVYMSGSSICAQKQDFDGETIWGHTVIYNKGGLSSAPMHTNLKIVPVERGAFVSWYADPDGNNFEDAFCSYINLNGQIVFGTGTDGTKLSHNNMRQFSPRGVYDAANKYVYYVWREDNSSQAQSRIVSQKINLQGELEWDYEGVEVGALLPRRADYANVQIDSDGNPCFFYLVETESTKEYAGYAQKRAPNGDSLWNTVFTTVSEQGDRIHYKKDLLVLPYKNNQWVALWKDNRPEATSMSNQDHIWGQNILVDGSLGYDPGDVATETKISRSDASSFGVTSNPASGSTCFVVKNMQGSKAEISISNVAGQKVATLFNGTLGSDEEKIVWNIPAQLPKGVYFATLRGTSCSISSDISGGGQYSETIKVIKK